jgi:hypothetical protein
MTGKGGIQPDIEIPVDRDTEVKLQAQSEEIYAKGKEVHSAVSDTEKVKDVALDRAIEILKIRPLMLGQKEG